MVRGPLVPPGSTGTRPPAGNYAGTNFNDSQCEYAALIAFYGVPINGVGYTGVKLAIQCAIGESGLRDDASVANKNLNSVGLFQQRPSSDGSGWGTVAQCEDPQHSSLKFYEALLKIPNFAALTPTAAIHAVQINADPNYYTPFEGPALALIAAMPSIMAGAAPPAAGPGGTSDNPGLVSSGYTESPWPAHPPVDATPDILLTATAEVDLITLNGAKITGKLRDAVTAATASLATDQSQQISITFYDPGFELFNAGAFNLSTTDTTAALPAGSPAAANAPAPGPTSPMGAAGALIATMTYADMKLVIVSRTIAPADDGEPLVTVVGRSLAVWALQQRRNSTITGVTSKAVGSEVNTSGFSPTDFVMEECRQANIQCIAQPSPQRSVAITRDPIQPGQHYVGSAIPSSWTTMSRLAGEEGFDLFEVGGTVYFGRPSWLVNNLNNTTYVSWQLNDETTDIYSVPTLDDSEDNELGATMTFDAPIQRASVFRPGRRIIFQGAKGSAFELGFPGYPNQAWLCSSVDFDLAGLSGVVSVGAVLPRDPYVVIPGFDRPTAATSGNPGSSSPIPITAPAIGSGVFHDGSVPLINNNPNSLAQALAFAAYQQSSGSHAWHNICATFVEKCYASTSGYGTSYAIDRFGQLPASQKGTDYNPPVGACLIWDMHDRAGHVTLYAGNGMAYSSDQPNNVGEVSLVDANFTHTVWKGDYVGWIQPVF